MSDQLVDSGRRGVAGVQRRVRDGGSVGEQSFFPESTPGQRLIARMNIAEGRAALASEQLLEAVHRTQELKIALDSMRNVLRRCRESRDEWKRRAMVYQHDKQRYRQRAYYYRAQRDLWRYRALAKDDS